jgi:hypothetical protein
MFKESLKNKAKNVFGGTMSFVKEVGGEFKNAMTGALVDELTNRSPVLGAALAGSIKAKADKKHNERLKTSFTKLYADSAANTSDNPFASKVQADIGKDATKEEVQKKIVGILTQLDKDVKIQSKSDLENNELYKRYSKEFQEYKKVINKQLAQKPSYEKKQKAQSEATPTPVQDNTEIVQKLESIDTNTQETNDRLSDLISKVEKPSEQEPSLEVTPAKAIPQSEIQDEYTAAYKQAEKKRDKESMRVIEIGRKQLAATKTTSQSTPEVIQGSESTPEVVSIKAANADNYGSVLKSLKDLVTIDSNVEKTTGELVEEAKETNRILKENEVERAKDEAESEESAQEVVAKKASQAVTEPNDNEKQVEKQPPRTLVRVLKDKATDLLIRGGVAAGGMAINGAKALGGLALKGGKAVVESVRNSGVAGTIKEGLSKATEKVMGTAGKAKEGLVNLASKAKETIANRAPAIKEGMKSATQKVMGTVPKVAEAAKTAGATVAKTAGSLGSKALSTVATVGGRFAGMAAPAAGAISSVALPAAALATAGFAGYKAGEWLNENTNVQSNIADGVDKVKGWFGNSDEDKQKEADKKSAQDLYEKRVKEGKLTTKSAEFFEKQGIKVDKSKITAAVTPEVAKQVTPVKNPVTAEVSKNVEQKEQNTAQKEQKSAQPIVINNSNNSSSSGGSSKGPSQFSNMITGISVRNSESTFERVQMQDFWPRTA